MADLVLGFLFNFCVVTLAIALFFLPFVGSFWYRNREEIKKNNPHFNYFMEKFFRSKESNALIFTWAAAEAVVWFVIPEFLLILIMFMKVSRKFQLVIYDVLGTLAGTAVALYLNFSQTTLLSIPYVYQGMIDQVQTWYNDYGILGIFFQPFSGIPYKVFNSLAIDNDFFIPLFLIAAVVARMLRYLIVYEVTKAIYPFVYKFIRQHYAILFILAIAVFTVLLTKVSNSYS